MQAIIKSNHNRLLSNQIIISHIQDIIKSNHNRSKQAIIKSDHKKLYEGYYQVKS